MATHHKSNTRLYKLWCSMRHRCNTKSDSNYHKYGAKGIKVCDEWNKNFMSFYNWSISNGYQDNLSIDRIDNNKGYSPDNCRWLTMLQQMNNTTRTKMITYKGKTQSIPNWCRELNLNYKTVRTRINQYGWDVERAFTTKTNIGGL